MHNADLLHQFVRCNLDFNAAVQAAALGAVVIADRRFLTHAVGIHGDIAEAGKYKVVFN